MKSAIIALLGLCTIASVNSELRSSVSIPVKTQVGNKFTVLAKQYHFDGAENALKPWFESMEFCQANGWEPARIDSAEENRIVAQLLLDNFGSSHVFWLGASDWGQDGVFYWLRTGQNVAYNNFAAGYPSGGRAESCIYVWGDGLWYDQFCTVADVRPLCQTVS